MPNLGAKLQFSPYHSRYWAELLTLRGPIGDLESLSRSINSAAVDLNPHQVDAAVFAIRSPLSKGAMLADEVGLGKTIEAGLVIAQRWAERRRRILLILPATLRKQWQQELKDKFGIQSEILETPRRSGKNANQANLETEGRVLICSYQYAVKFHREIQKQPWDLVVIDEAHRLRNVYKDNDLDRKTMAGKLKWALAHSPKLLLTATPLQNNLLELYGLVSIIDDHVFGSKESFSEQFVGKANEHQRDTQLRSRLGGIIKRTLRKDVLEYINYTNRIPLTQEFVPSDAEHQLYEDISDYLRRPTLAALPSGQRQLMTLVMRKLLASSTFAIAGTLEGLVDRLSKQAHQQGLFEEGDYEGGLDALKEELLGDEDPEIDPALLMDEIGLLQKYADQARSIHQNSKGHALVQILEEAFKKIDALGAQRKAVIFTESTRTQSYLKNLLSEQGYQGKIVLMNGSNADKESGQIYQNWLKRHAGSGQISGSKSADMKAAIVEEFKDRSTLLIATESAAEGVNLQFCSLLINYDLPWNPQRVEQRIGRVHRYGQKFDVVVVNFINKRNEADQRVYELLNEKFRLFEGVFGASDDVLGSLESGVDFERKIAEIYQNCRTPTEINQKFDELQAELAEVIQDRMKATKQALLENFDEDIHNKLKGFQQKTLQNLNARQLWLLHLTEQELGIQTAGQPAFEHQNQKYFLDWRQAQENDGVFYHTEHELARQLIDQAQHRNLPDAEMVFDYSAHGSKISSLEPHLGKKGYMQVNKLTIRSVEEEDHLLLAAFTDDGAEIEPEIAGKLLSLPVKDHHHLFFQLPAEVLKKLSVLAEIQKQLTLEQIDQRNASHLDQEMQKLDAWAEDLRQGLETELSELLKQIREADKTVRRARNTQEKLEASKLKKQLEDRRKQKQRTLYDEQDEISQQYEDLLKSTEEKLKVQQDLQPLFTLRWKLI